MIITNHDNNHDHEKEHDHDHEHDQPDFIIVVDCVAALAPPPLLHLPAVLQYNDRINPWFIFKYRNRKSKGSKR